MAKGTADISYATYFVQGQSCAGFSTESVLKCKQKEVGKPCTQDKTTSPNISLGCLWQKSAASTCGAMLQGGEFQA